MTIPVSVVMPVYNCQDFLPEAIESIKSQTFGNFEFIVVDDCSTDSSLAIAIAYQKNDARIHIHHNKNNTGIADARNTGLQLAQGKYIAWMDSDDVSMPGRIERQFRYMESHPDIGITGTDALMIDEKGNILADIQMPQSHILITWAFCFYDPIINPTVMANRELCIRAGGYRGLAKDRKEYFPEDYDLWTRLSNKTNFHNIDEDLLKLRKHSKNITHTRLQSTLKNSCQICQKYLQTILDDDIPHSLVEMIWEISDSPSLRSMPQFIEKLYNHFANLPGISSQEKQYIREDASLRLIRMAKRYPYDLYCLPTIGQALKINPGLPLVLLDKILHKPPSYQENG